MKKPPYPKERVILSFITALGVAFEMIIVGIFIAALVFLAAQVEAQCLNDDCNTAIEIGCNPTYFDNYDCTTTQVNVLTHPVVSTVHCGGTNHHVSQWFTFTATHYNNYLFDIVSDYSNESGYTGNYGAFEGVMWALATGSCDDLVWIAAGSCPSHPEKCFCGPPGANAWAGLCADAPCQNPHPLSPWWHEPWNTPQLFPSGDWLPYDPTRQEWHMIFPLPAGTYYVLISGFSPYNSAQQQLYPSTGTGVVTMCAQGPLAAPPVLSHTSTELMWTGTTTTTFKIHQLDVMTTTWHTIGQTDQHHWPLTSGGYYRVSNQFGYSDPVHVAPIIQEGRGVIYNVLGQQHAKYGIEAKP